MNAKHWLWGAYIGLPVAIIAITIVPQAPWFSGRVQVALQLVILAAAVALVVQAAVRRSLALLLCGMGFALTIVAPSGRWVHLVGSAVVMLGVLYGWKTRAFLA